jgi:hypothetical protein
VGLRFGKELLPEGKKYRFGSTSTFNFEYNLLNRNLAST